MDEFESIIGNNFGEEPQHVFEYETLEVSADAPEPIQPGRKNRQWALVDAEGTIVALGPATGGGKSRFIKFAAENDGFRVAHRWVESGEWRVPKE